MQKNTSYYTEKQLKEVRKLAEQTGLTVAEILRRALDSYLFDQALQNKRGRK